MHPSIDELLQKGKAAANRNDHAAARRLLGQVVRLDPQNEQGWLWLCGVVETPEQQRDCLERVLRINPANALAREAFADLFPGQPLPTPTRPIPTTPTPQPSAPPAPKLETRPFGSGRVSPPNIDDLDVAPKRATKPFGSGRVSPPNIDDLDAAPKRVTKPFGSGRVSPPNIDDLDVAPKRATKPFGSGRIAPPNIDDLDVAPKRATKPFGSGRVSPPNIDDLDLDPPAQGAEEEHQHHGLRKRPASMVEGRSVSELTHGHKRTAWSYIILWCLIWALHVVLLRVGLPGPRLGAGGIVASTLVQGGVQLIAWAVFLNLMLRGLEHQPLRRTSLFDALSQALWPSALLALGGLIVAAVMASPDPSTATVAQFTQLGLGVASLFILLRSTKNALVSQAQSPSDVRRLVNVAGGAFVGVWLVTQMIGWNLITRL